MNRADAAGPWPSVPMLRAVEPQGPATDAWRTAPPGETEPQVASWVRALRWGGKALERAALEAIGAALVAWKAIEPGRTEHRDQVLETLGRWLQSAMPGLPRVDRVGEVLRQQVPGLMRESGGDPDAAALQLLRGLERGETGGTRAPAARERPLPPGRPPESGPRRPPPGRSPPPGGGPQPVPVGGPRADASPERLELDHLRRELSSLHAHWQRSPRAFTDAQIRAGGRHVPDTVQRRLDAVASRPGVADSHARALGEVRALARRLDEAALRYTVHQVIAGHERLAPAALQALRGLAQDRLRGGDGPGGGDAALLRGLAASRVRGAAVTHTRGTGATHGEAAGETALREHARHATQLERARQERLRARRHELPYADREGAVADTAVRHGVSPQALSTALQLAGARLAFGSASGPVGGPPNGSGGQAAPSGSSGSRHVVHKQPIQEPQQAPGADSESRAEAARLRFDRFVKSFPHPVSHLELRPGEGGLVIHPERLERGAREAYDRLVGQLDEALLNALASSLVLGEGDRIGLAALGRTWRNATGGGAPPVALPGTTVTDLGRVVFDAPGFGTLQDLAGLTGVETATDRGLLHPTEDRAVVSQWFDGVTDGIFHFNGLTQPQPDVAQIEASPWFLDHLRTIQQRLDSTKVVPGLSWPPWTGSDDPHFQATLAAREAIWFAWRSAGLDDARLQALPGGPSPTWAKAAEAVPGLAQLDFSRAFDDIDRAFRSALPKVLLPYEPEMNALYVGMAASAVAAATFEDSGLRDRLFTHLRTIFVDPRAVRAYGETREFTEFAAEMATDLVAEDAGLTRSWVKALMRDALRSQAEVLRRGPDETRPLLGALERLAIGEDESERTARDYLKQQMRLVEQHHGSVLAAVARRLTEFGFQPTEPSPTVAGSLRDAVLRQLESAGIGARLEAAGPDGRPPTFVIERQPGPVGGGGGTEVDPMLSLARREAMDAVVAMLRTADFPTRWRFADDGR